MRPTREQVKTDVEYITHILASHLPAQNEHYPALDLLALGQLQELQKAARQPRATLASTYKMVELLLESTALMAYTIGLHAGKEHCELHVCTDCGMKKDS